jgi:hypothetical protein
MLVTVDSRAEPSDRASPFYTAHTNFSWYDMILVVEHSSTCRYLARPGASGCLHFSEGFR